MSDALGGDHETCIQHLGLLGLPRLGEGFPAPHVGVRPEHLEIVGREGGAWTGTAVHSESLGADSFVYLDIGDEDLMTVRLPGTAEIAAGTTVSVAPRVGQYYLFNTMGQAVSGGNVAGA